jgi:hypothetical protein
LSQFASIAGNADKRRRLNEASSASEVAEILTMKEEQVSVQSTDT